MIRSIARAKPLSGTLYVPGDKSISHRALIFGALARGVTGITGLGPGGDIQSTARCLRALGVEIDEHEVRKQPMAAVKGLGLRGLKAPQGELDCGNSGTTMRLLMGVLAGQGHKAKLTGDDSLKGRPMARVADPLTEMGAKVKLSKGGRAPLTVEGGKLKGIHFSSAVASAQVKSAVLLAGLLAEGKTSVTEPALSRDHTERMLAHFGVPVERDGLTVSVSTCAGFSAQAIRVPGDPSSAAFWTVAASFLEGSELKILELLANPTRTAFLDVLERMGADLRREAWEEGIIGAVEPVMDLTVKSAKLRAADISAAEVPGLIDEIPILALAASQASGVSRFSGLSELRHKESDRLQAIAKMLKALGGSAHIEGDDLIIEGPTPLKGCELQSRHDHRLAMTGLIAGCLASGETTVVDAECADISYPGFYDELKRLCA